MPSEYNYVHIEGAVNLPLKDIRKLATTLLTSKEYMLYCQTGGRSSVAAFILAQFGLNVFVFSHEAKNSI